MFLDIVGEVNYLAVLVAAIVGMALGWLWYGPVFGKTWIGLIGWTQEQMARMKEQGMTKSYFVNFVATLVLAWVLALFVYALGANTFWLGVCIGAWMWLGFVATIMLGSILWEGRSGKLYLLNVSYWLVALGLLGGILAVWQ